MMIETQGGQGRNIHVYEKWIRMVESGKEAGRARRAGGERDSGNETVPFAFPARAVHVQDLAQGSSVDSKDTPCLAE